MILGGIKEQRGDRLILVSTVFEHNGGDRQQVGDVDVGDGGALAEPKCDREGRTTDQATRHRA